MCGIVGFITDESTIGAYNRKKWFIQALIADSLRGTDGTGAFFAGHKQDGPADWCKQGSHPYDLLDSDIAAERFTKPFDTIRCAIGHNRSATVGKASTENSHPFQEGPITLVHNGTLHITSTLPKAKYDLKGVDVDSHVITHNLAEHPAEEIIPKLSGAFALVWHDARDNSINVVRNSERPLHFLRATCERTILMASEPEMLVWLARRNNFRVGEVFYPLPGQYLKFLPDRKLDPVVTKLDLYTPPSYGRRRSSNGGIHEFGDSDFWDGSWVPKQDDKKPSTGKEGPNMGKGQAADPNKHLPQQMKKALSRQSRLPRAIKAHLRAMNLEPLDKLRFQVTGYTRVHGTQYANVMGNLMDINRQGLVMGMEAASVQRAPLDKEIWTVAPIVERKGPGGGVLLARLLSRSANFKTTETPGPSSTSSPADSSTDQTGASEGDDLFEDKPFYDWMGKEVDYHKWLALTADGCLYCKAHINPIDAPEMSWDDDTRLPVCAQCTEELNEYAKFEEVGGQK